MFKRFAELVKGRIAGNISHRFSTVRLSKRIFVLEHGRVLEDGTHDELIAKQGMYAELFALQAKGYR